ncbi:MAG TPA: hypothetical protein PKE04_08665 [Clostridia bacterium]|nr:hypothetical protein [Clostridia bacterium]
MPDIIGGPSNDEVISYSQYGALAPIDTHMQEWMPNFVAAMHNGKDDEIEKMLTLEDGHIYALPAIGLAYYTCGAAQFINTAWLEALNLSMPATVDGLYDVLVAFRDGDPNGNGLADEIPFSFDWSYAGQDIHLGGMYAWFGVSPGLLIVDGKVSYSPYQEDYKTLVSYLNKLWKDNLIDKEVFTQSGSTYAAKGVVNPSIYGVVGGWRKGLLFGEANYNDYEVLPALKCEETAMSGALRTHMGEGREWTFNRATVSAQSKNLEIALRWLDIFYDPFYGSQIADGHLGVHLFQREDGQFQEVPDSQIPSQYASRSEWKNYTMANSFPYYKSVDHATFLSTNALWAQEMNHQSEVYQNDYINDIIYPSYQLPSENERITSYATDIVSYVNEMFAQWVTGERDVNADWNDYLAHLEALGVSEYVAAYQAYYDRVMK